jgi:hypothetical protein
MSARGKGKVTRLRRPATAKPLWTDAEVLALVDAVLIARDTELAQRVLMVLGSRYGVGADRESTLADLKGVPHHEIQYAALRLHDVENAPAHLGRLLGALAHDPASRGPLKRLVARIGKELARGRAKLEASSTRHQVPA